MLKETTTTDREIIITRTVQAPRELVFEVWTKPEHVAHWWGPNGFTNTIFEMDVRPGGVFRFIMHGPDGTDYPNKIVFTEVVKPERLSYYHDSGVENDPLGFVATALFEAEGPKQTRITLKSVFKTPEALAKVVREFNAAEGGKQHLARLEEYLSKM